MWMRGLRQNYEMFAMFLESFQPMRGLPLPGAPIFFYINRTELRKSSCSCECVVRVTLKRSQNSEGLERRVFVGILSVFVILCSDTLEQFGHFYMRWCDMVLFRTLLNRSLSYPSMASSSAPLCALSRRMRVFHESSLPLTFIAASDCYLAYEQIANFNISWKRESHADIHQQYQLGCALSSSMYTRGGSSRRATGLQPSLKNVRQKIPPNGQTRLKFGFSYENFTTQSFSVLMTPFHLNVS